MMRRRNFTIWTVLLCLAVAAGSLASCAALAKGKGKGNHVPPGQAKVKMSGQVPNFPLPYEAIRIHPGRQKAAKGWYEYRVIGLSRNGLVSFYRAQMPRRGWKLGHYKGGNWVWIRGRQRVTVVFVQIGPFSLIQVRAGR